MNHEEFPLNRKEIFSDQAKLYKLLYELVGPGPAILYKDACFLLQNDLPLESKTHLIFHLFREIESAIREVIIPICKDFKVKKSESGQKQEIEAICKFFNLNDNDPIKTKWLFNIKHEDYENKNTLHILAHRYNLNKPKDLDKNLLSIIIDFQNIFTTILEKFQSKYLDIYEKIDNIIKNSEFGKIDKLPNIYHVRRYLFQKAISKKWLEYFQKNRKRYFSDPPKVKIEDGRHIFENWPESEYLAKMAKDYPDIVLSIILSVPDTNNIHVQSDFIEAALYMKPDLSIEIALLAISWIGSNIKVFFYTEYAKLISHLARGGFITKSMEIAQALLDILPDPEYTLYDDVEKYMFPPNPKSILDLWEYSEIVFKHLLQLTDIAAIELLRIFCELLNKAIRYSKRPYESSNAFDYSHIWRPNIEAFVQDTLKDILVTAIMKVSDTMMIQNSVIVFNELRRSPYSIFKRMELALRRKYWDIDRTGTIELLHERELFTNHTFENEINAILQEKYPDLPQEIKDLYFSIIDEEKSFEDYKNIQIFFRREATQEDYQVDLEFNRFRKLLPIRKFLQGPWLDVLNSLDQKFDEAKIRIRNSNPEMHFVSGEDSPVDISKLREMNVLDFIGYLRDFEPSDDPIANEYEGLCIQIQNLVSDNPQKYAHLSNMFKGLDPDFISAVIEGFTQAIDRKCSFSWPEILELCFWVIQQERDAPVRKGRYAQKSPGWEWTRNRVLRLLSRGLENKDSPISMELRDRIKDIIIPLMDDPDPTPETEGNERKDSWSFDNIAINSIRGEALSCLIRYGLWIHRSMGREKPHENGFSDMPEIREILDRHLDIEVEPTLAIRSVYGRWFPYIALLDTSWARDNVQGIFPQNEELVKYRKVAWTSYITFNTAYTDTFGLLRDEYEYALNQLDPSCKHDIKDWSPESRLCEHMIVLFWYDAIDLDYLTKVYEHFSPNLRKYATGFLGGNLKRIKIRLDEVLIERCKNFWLWRIESIARTPEDSELRMEAMEFDGWFTSGKFDKEWSIHQLYRALEVSKASKEHFHHDIVATLATYVNDYPLLTLQCLEKLIVGDINGWNIVIWRNDIKNILKSVIDDGAEKERELAIDLVHRLGARGDLSYRDLLKQ